MKRTCGRLRCKNMKMLRPSGRFESKNIFRVYSLRYSPRSRRCYSLMDIPVSNITASLIIPANLVSICLISGTAHLHIPSREPVFHNCKEYFTPHCKKMPNRKPFPKYILEKKMKSFAKSGIPKKCPSLFHNHQ